MFNVNGDLSFVVTYGKLVKIVGRDEAENILRIASLMNGTLEDKMEYLQDLVWSLECMQAEEIMSVRMCN